jgi:catechol 2,3-dioxygenase-like lactoylglutathione lyase family enzyme
MPLKLDKQALDIGIVVRDEEAMVAFYGGTLGLVKIGTFPVPNAMQHRYEMGATTMKLVVPNDPPAARPPGRTISEGTGIRYWTAFCIGLEDIVAECAAAGSEVVTPVSTGSTGLHYAVLTDPDGNCFELIEL